MSSSTAASTKGGSSNSRGMTATHSTSAHISLSLTQSSSDGGVTSPFSTSIPIQTATTTDSVTAVSTAASSDTSGHSAPVAVIVVLVVVVLCFISSGVTFFLCKRKRRKQQSVETPDAANHEPKKAASHLQSSLLDGRSCSKTGDYYDDDIKSPVHSLDSGLDLTSRAKPRSSRASSSIFVPDDTVTIASRSNFLRPVSLGEPIALKSIQLAYGQMPTLPESPLQPSTNMEQRASPVPLTTSESSGSSEGDDDDKKSTHTFTVTRPETPEPAPPLPLMPNQLPPLPPVPPIRYSMFNDSSRRDSSNTLAPSRYDEPSRPQSMASVYSTRSQRADMDDRSTALSPDITEVLSRLKKRISTPWSINSVVTSRTERMSVTRASEEA